MIVLALARKLLPYVFFTLAIVTLGYVIYRNGYRNGSREILLQWEQDKATVRATQDALVESVNKREELHRQEQEKISNELAQARKQHEVAIADQRITFEQRLLQSARRADVYQRQAEAGAAAQRDLANHAAKLDRSLEEGRELVNELGATLRLREDQLKLLGEQLLNERQLFSDN